MENCQPNDRLDILVQKLASFDIKQKRKNLIVKHEINGTKPSKAQKDYRDAHPTQERLDAYEIHDLGNHRYRVFNTQHGEMTEDNSHIVSPCRFQCCDRDNCKVNCEKCNSNICKVHKLF